ncbi:MAG TPA: ATP-dependent helicase [Aggregatilineales bacterium]|nr:ATP-dependent helicase [Anaerolineales bacterium]HRE46213.1 ATP-dependent helicase [Aggregatilineales bacterium]
MTQPKRTSKPFFRSGQKDILSAPRGRVGVSAVPGSGKTFTLTHLAATIIERMADQAAKGGKKSAAIGDQEVLIVTFANAAANAIKARIAEILGRKRDILPHVGYRVRTLHGLAHDIVRERPALAGLADDFQIVDERTSEKLLSEVVTATLRTSGADLLRHYIHGDHEANIPRLLSNDAHDLFVQIALRYIGRAKDRELTPADLRTALAAHGDDPARLPLARFGLEVYENYQRGLQMRGAVDFNDLVRMALMALRTDAGYLARLRARYTAILEDEAQDSSALQETLIRLLDPADYWVRVGDPNQAINTTFTSADPRFLTRFLDSPQVKAFLLPEAGRSAASILDLANELVRWTRDDHPVPELRSALRPQQIVPTTPNDPQPNPPVSESQVFIAYEPGQKITPDRERELIIASLQRYLPENPERTIACLVPENAGGFKLSEKLHEAGIPYEELLRSTSTTRETAARLRTALEFIATPAKANGAEKLAALYRDYWFPRNFGAENDHPAEYDLWRDTLVKGFNACRRVEAFIAPPPDTSPLEAISFPYDVATLDALYHDDLERFRATMARWLRAAILPIDQLVLTIGQDLYSEPAEIALCYKIAHLLGGVARNDPTARLSIFIQELEKISKNERKFIGFEDTAEGYQPKPGVVTVATMHAAKGLEWDRVYLLSVNNYSFPSRQPYDHYIAERYYIRDSLNVEAEALQQLTCLVEGAAYYEGAATEQARIDYSAERLRLLYVGITRAKRDLIVLWNVGRFHHRGADREQQPALPLMALWGFMEKRRG